MTEDLPTVVSEATFTVGGIQVRCYVLTNGQRVINADDFESLMEFLHSGQTVVEVEEYEKLQRWYRESMN